MGSDPSEQVPNERLMPLGCSKLGGAVQELSVGRR